MGFFLSLFLIYGNINKVMENSTNSSDIKRQSSDGLNNVISAKLFPRFVSFIVDLAITAFVFFGLLLFTQNVICVNSPYVKKAKEEFLSYNIESGLFDRTEGKDEYHEKTFESYKGYQDLFLSYYTDYLVNKCPEEYRVNYNGQDIYWFNVHVLGQNDARGLYTEDIKKLNDLVTKTAPTLFTYKLDGENNPLYDEVALPIYSENNPDAVLTEAQEKTLTAYFYISDADNKDNQTCYYHLVVEDLTARPFVSKAYDTWYNHSYYYPIISCLLFTLPIFFLIIPLCFKNGETLGKLVFKLGLVNKLGYRHSKLQLIPRFLLSVSIIAILYFLLGVNLISLGILTFLALASYGLTIFTKGHKAIHDYLAGTMVVDKVHSEIYLNAEEEAKAKAEIEKVNPIITDVAKPRDESILYENPDFNNNDKKEG